MIKPLQLLELIGLESLQFAVDRFDGESLLEAKILWFQFYRIGLGSFINLFEEYNFDCLSCFFKVSCDKGNDLNVVERLRLWFTLIEKIDETL
jgi:hypothetical protein